MLLLIVIVFAKFMHYCMVQIWLETFKEWWGDV